MPPAQPPRRDGAGSPAPSHDAAARTAAARREEELAGSAFRIAPPPSDAAATLQPHVRCIVGAPLQAAELSIADQLRAAGARALGGGLAGASAMVLNVVCMMWLRTALFAQYARGLTLREALRTVYAEGRAAGGGSALGGVSRFYRGVGYALMLAPLSRFGDTACNAGAQALFAHRADAQPAVPLVAQTAVAALGSGAFRALIAPLDVLKTMAQVEGARAPAVLRQKIAALGPRRALYAGAAGAASAHAASYFPWFTVHNALQARVPRSEQDGAAGLAAWTARAAGIGLAASAVSDVTSNALHVLKTRKQTAPDALTYPQAFRAAAAAGGGVLRGVFLRGLGTKMCASAANGVIFTILWNAAEERLLPPITHEQHA